MTHNILAFYIPVRDCLTASAPLGLEASLMSPLISENPT